MLAAGTALALGRRMPGKSIIMSAPAVTVLICRMRIVARRASVDVVDFILAVLKRGERRVVGSDPSWLLDWNSCGK